MDSLTRLHASKVEVPEDPDEVNRYFYQQGWTDGLPIIPPTEERVGRMLEAVGRDADEVIGIFPPANNKGSVGHIAINAVMAGCLPEHMPVLIAAVEGMLEEAFTLDIIQATTHPVAPLVIVNGPIRDRLSFNSGSNVFGPCNRANATVGRAVRLILLNVGGAVPGVLDHATHGQPSKYSFCIAENEEMNPWEPLHVELGFDRSVSTVTVWGGENPHNINDHESKDAVGLLTTFAGTIATQGNNTILYRKGDPLIVICPEHARLLADGGYSKQRVKEFLFENARVPKKSFSKDNQAILFSGYGDDDLIPVVQKPEDYVIVVAGGHGKHSLYCPGYAVCRSVTKAIEEPA